MCVDDIKIVAKNEKELETLKQIICIYSHDIRIEFYIEECIMLMMKSGKRETTWGLEFSNQERIQMRWLFLIVICFVLMLYNLYAIVEKDRVYVVDRIIVEWWGLFLM